MSQEQCDMCQRKFDSDSMSDVKPEFITYDIRDKLCMRCTSIYLQLTNVIHSEWIKRGQLEYAVIQNLKRSLKTIIVSQKKDGNSFP